MCICFRVSWRSKRRFAWPTMIGDITATLSFLIGSNGKTLFVAVTQSSCKVCRQMAVKFGPKMRVFGYGLCHGCVTKCVDLHGPKGNNCCARRRAGQE